MRFKGLDLNLLVALDALLSERNVSAAARRVFISQPAMSSALARLRDHFQDELLAPVGRRMAPTAFADALTEPLRALMLQIEATVGAGQRFDPATARRKFTISVSDYITEVMMGAVVARAAIEAPGVLLEIMPPTESPARSLESGDIDVLITPDLYSAPAHPSELLYEEEHGGTGTLVLLNTGEVAVVTAQSRTRRLRPEIMVILDAEKRPLGDYRVVDLNRVSATADDQASLWIEQGLEPGAYGVDPAEYYLN